MDRDPGAHHDARNNPALVVTVIVRDKADDFSVLQVVGRRNVNDQGFEDEFPQTWILQIHRRFHGISGDNYHKRGRLSLALRNAVPKDPISTAQSGKYFTSLLFEFRPRLFGKKKHRNPHSHPTGSIDLLHQLAALGRNP